MKAHTPAPIERVLEEEKDSVGKKTKEVEHDVSADDAHMEEADQSQVKWKPRPVADPLGPVEVK